MARRQKTGTSNKVPNAANGANVGYEAQFWQMADALRGSMVVAEYQDVFLRLIFLNNISDPFDEQHAHLFAQQTSGPEPKDLDEFRAQSVIWVPPEGASKGPSETAHYRPARERRYKKGDVRARADISNYGQESNDITGQLDKLNCRRGTSEGSA